MAGRAGAGSGGRGKVGWEKDEVVETIMTVDGQTLTPTTPQIPRSFIFFFFNYYFWSPYVKSAGADAD